MNSPEQDMPRATRERLAKESLALRENLRKRKEQRAARQTEKSGTAASNDQIKE